jgi:transcription initiation factor TFIIB
MVLTNAHPIAPTCPECGGDTETADGETICAECGLVLTEYLIDHGPEWSGRDSNGESRSRTGAPLTEARHDRGLSTKIGHSRGLTDRQQRMFARLRTHHSRANLRSKRRRNQLFAFSEIRKIAADLGLPTHVRDQACSLFRSAQRADLIRGRTLEGFAAAAVYIAARVGHISRTREEITTAAKSHIPELKVALTAMNRDLGVQVPPPAPKEYLPGSHRSWDSAVASRHVQQRSSGRSPPRAQVPVDTPAVSLLDASTPPRSSWMSSSPRRHSRRSHTSPP